MSLSTLSQCSPTIFPPRYQNDPNRGGNPTAPYNLEGIQVEPESAYWTEGNPAPLRVIEVSEVVNLVVNNSDFRIDPYPIDPTALAIEIDEIKNLEAWRDDPNKLVEPLGPIVRRPISAFINTIPPAFGAVFPSEFVKLPPDINVNQWNDLLGNTQVIRTGRQLARMFEAETPGLYHHHALSILLFKRPDISPARQARIRMALDIAIYSSLVAAWYFKWAANLDPSLPTPHRYSYRQRPYEFDRNMNFRVLYDDAVDDDGHCDKCGRKNGTDSPGTPRHPAYPSGHSTHSSAASEILKYFFHDQFIRDELDNLSNNIGVARLWAGVHWRTDHDAGVVLGKAIARLIQDQLERDCISPVSAKPVSQPPDDNTVKINALAIRNGACSVNQDNITNRPMGNDCDSDEDGHNFVF